jgi:ferrochelatase
LLLNLGTPEAPEPREVRRYLREFLSDPRVIDLPAIWRALFVYLVILPVRPRRSAEAYRKIWTARGSPLLFHGWDLATKLGDALGAPVELGMRYGRPSIAGALARLRAQGLDRIAVLPLFPQYSSAAWGSAVERLFADASRLANVPAFEVVPPFYDHPAFVEAFAAVARPVLADLAPERVIMSFHGLPERQIAKSDESGGAHCLRSEACCERIVDANRFCYRAQCFATARAIAARLELPPDRWEVAFQSRLGRTPWIRPYTDVRVREIAAGGVKRVAVLCPSFVADCLETLEEIGIRAHEDFRAHGGDELRLVPSLNSEPVWVEGAARILRETGFRGSTPPA